MTLIVLMALKFMILWTLVVTNMIFLRPFLFWLGWKYFLNSDYNSQSDFVKSASHLFMIDELYCRPQNSLVGVHINLTNNFTHLLW